MEVLRWQPEDMVFEQQYNVWGKRLFPWDRVPQPAWGGAWIAVDPKAVSAPHGHDECEMFFIIQGEGLMQIDGETERVKAGDTVFIPPFGNHSLTNLGDDRLLFITVWWGGGESQEAVATGAGAQRQEEVG
jgi:mannose-6-phosphate isomerase-like protein (cupin superfamily)